MSATPTPSSEPGPTPRPPPLREGASLPPGSAPEDAATAGLSPASAHDPASPFAGPQDEGAAPQSPPLRGGWAPSALAPLADEPAPPRLPSEERPAPGSFSPPDADPVPMRPPPADAAATGTVSADDGAAWLGVTALLCLGAIVVGIGAAAADGIGPGSRWSNALEWRPGLGAAQPWRWWTAAWVHWSTAHLAVNLLGASVVGFVGWRARMPRRAALAWFIAWPLTQALMGVPGTTTVAETLRHYGGLSGVLHAGVVVLGLTLLRTRAGAPRPAAPRLDAPTTQHQATLSPARTTEGPWAMTSLEESFGGQRLDEPWPSAAPAPLSEAQAARHRWVGLALVAGTLAKVLLEAPWDLALRPNALLGIQVAPLAHACGIAAGTLAWAGGMLARATGRRPEQG